MARLSPALMTPFCDYDVAYVLPLAICRIRSAA
jgi:hypothetical protein